MIRIKTNPLIDIKNNVFSLLRLLYHAFKTYKTKIVILTFLGMLSGLVEAVGVSTVIPLFSFLTGAGEGTDFISQTVEKGFYFIGIPFTMRYVLGFVILLFIFRTVALFFANYIRISITADYEERTRTDLFNKTLKASWSLLLKQKLGHLETMMMVNISHGERLLNTVSSLTVIVTGLAMYTLVALNISFNVTVITVLLSAFLLVFIKPLISRTHTLAKEVELVNRQVAHHVNENILGMKTIKSMQVDHQILEIGKRFFSTLRRLKVRIAFFRLIPVSLMQPLGLIFVVLIFAYSYKSSNFNLAAFLAVMYLIQRMFIFVEQFQSQLHIAIESSPYLQEVVDYAARFSGQEEGSPGSRKFSFDNQLVFQDVEFAYANRRAVLQDVNFTIPRGSTVGLIGPSGSGKTTIVDMMLRLFKPTAGKISIDGNDIESIDIHEWRRSIGYVAQDIFLINDTIANNVRFYDSELTRDEIESAIKMADMDDFIKELPSGLDTVVGERGIQLSGGQRQRIIIARVLARKPKILILDEATSALDGESETQIQNVIKKIKGQVTVIIIAHRLSTIMHSDEIVVLDNGRIVEKGLPEDLLNDKDSYFYKVYTMA
ncbi:MAG: ABC transporter ATP-binding protein [Patescibacteria group bacterium]